MNGIGKWEVTGKWAKWVKRKKRPPVDPLIREMKRVRKGTPVGQLEILLEERSKWKRRLTIADNKLRRVDEQIIDLASGLALAAVQPKDKV